MSNETRGKRGNKPQNDRRDASADLTGGIDVTSSLSGSPDDRRGASLVGSPDDR